MTKTLKLTGRVVVVTRDEDGDGPLGAALSERGASVVNVPLLRHEAPLDGGNLRGVAGRVGVFDWILFTSARGAEAMADALGGSLAGLAAKIACVGRATADCVRERKGEPALIARSAGAEGLVAELAERREIAGRRFLYPRAENARPDLVERLRAGGGRVEDVVAYRTVSIDGGASLLSAMAASSPDAIVFCSPSSVQGLGAAAVEKLKNSGVAIASMGPTTSRELRRVGIPPTAEPSERTFESMADCVAGLFAKKK